MFKRTLILIILLITSPFVSANNQDEPPISLLDMTQEERAAMEAEIEKKIAECEDTLLETGLISIEDATDIKRYCSIRVRTKGKKYGRFAKRIINERMTEVNPFVITPYKQSYILPFTLSDNFNTTPYLFTEDLGGEFESFANGMEDYEAKYQVSFKVPLTNPGLLLPGDGIYFGMTIQAWWQVYSDKISRPFRETNYQPELFYMVPMPFQLNEGNMLLSLHFEHQSNGQHQLLSRSWNRILAAITYEKNDYVVSLKPWYRLSEEDKEDPLNPLGDDNPDIEDYLGHYELTGAYAFSDDLKLSYLMRKNWKTGKGALELNVTYPLWGRLIGMVQVFTGYGESLIDYNHKQTKVGVGIALNDVF